LTSVAVNGEQLKDSVSTVMGALQKEISKEKQRKFSRQILKNVNFFEPQEVGGETVRDALTNEELYNTDKIYPLENRNQAIEYDKIGDKEIISILTKFQMDKGDELEDNDWLVIEENKKELQPFKGIQYSFKIASNTEGSALRNFYLKDLSYVKANQNESNYGFKFYGGNAFPTIKELGQKSRPKTFSELGGMAESDTVYAETFEEPKLKRIGVLRMDVDGLGKTFREAFSKRNTCGLVAYSVLSRSLDYFFKGYLNELRSNNEYKDSIQIIYAGGDDIFVMGKWDKIIDFAEDVRNDFKSYVCGNPTLSISGGIAIVTPKFPISKAAKGAEKGEDNAKDHYFDGKKKNAITLFGTSLNWDYEYKIVKMLKKEICKLSNASQAPLPRTFIYKINGYYEMAQSSKSLSWRWQIAYDLKRLAERSKRNAEVRDFLEELVQWSITHNIPKFVSQAFTEDLKAKKINFFKLLNIAVIWASYELRN
jgi:CRISPR-associated protein Csm1